MSSIRKIYKEIQFEQSQLDNVFIQIESVRENVLKALVNKDNIKYKEHKTTFDLLLLKAEQKTNIIDQKLKTYLSNIQ